LFLDQELVSMSFGCNEVKYDNGYIPDPMRWAAQIVSGLGFLGAGQILKAGFEVKV
jgi:uncharacterized membrane protein YhiD involved in acid resistance